MGTDAAAAATPIHLEVHSEARNRVVNRGGRRRRDVYARERWGGRGGDCCSSCCKSKWPPHVLPSPLPPTPAPLSPFQRTIHLHPLFARSRLLAPLACLPSFAPSPLSAPLTQTNVSLLIRLPGPLSPPSPAPLPLLPPLPPHLPPSPAAGDAGGASRDAGQTQPHGILVAGVLFELLVHTMLIEGLGDCQQEGGGRKEGTQAVGKT